MHRVGTLAVIKKMERAGEMMQIIVQGTQRVELLEVPQSTPYLAAQVRRLPDPDDAGTEMEALHREMLNLAGQVHALVAPEAQMGITQIIMQVQDPLHQAYLLGSMLNLDLEKEQALLAAETRVDALKLMHTYLTYEVQVLELRNKIASEAQSEMSREQREYVLRQQMRAIQEELGEGDPEEAELAELRRKLEEAESSRRRAQGSGARAGTPGAPAAGRARLSAHAGLPRADHRAAVEEARPTTCSICPAPGRSWTRTTTG